MIYNFTCTLKGIDFKYKAEADNITDAMIKVRNHIKNAVEISEFIQEPVNEKPNKFINSFKHIINEKS
jgi:predicted small metal-binding protein